MPTVRRHPTTNARETHEHSPVDRVTGRFDLSVWSVDGIVEANGRVPVWTFLSSVISRQGGVRVSRSDGMQSFCPSPERERREKSPSCTDAHQCSAAIRDPIGNVWSSAGAKCLRPFVNGAVNHQRRKNPHHRLPDRPALADKGHQQDAQSGICHEVKRLVGDTQVPRYMLCRKMGPHDERHPICQENSQTQS